MATYPVKWIHSGMRGAPQISGTAGTYLAALRAFLVTGFGQVTALSVTVSGGIATAMLQAGQSFAPYAVVLVDGATPSQLNGEARVLTASNSSITWATDAPDGSATGTITIRVAPVGGWQELFPGTPNKGVFRSADPHANGHCLRVDDTGTLSARVRGYESMTDVDTGIGPFPTDAQISGGGHWIKSGYASATAVAYIFAADSRTVFVAVSAGMTSGSLTATSSPIRGFGDMLALAPSGDVWSTALSCSVGTSLGSADNSSGGAFDQPLWGGNAIYVPRSLTGLGGAQATGSLPYVGAANGNSGADATLGQFPSPVDGQLKYSRRFIYHNIASANKPPRAEVPGMLTIPQSGVLGQINRLDQIEGGASLEGRALLAVATSGAEMSTTPKGICLLDITGPWRPGA